MPRVLPLSFTARVAALEAILNHPPDITPATLHTIKSLLASDNYAAVTDLILDRLVQFYPHQVLDRLLFLLTPPGLNQLTIPSEARITSQGLLTTLDKCKRLSSLCIVGGGEHTDNLSILPCLSSNDLSQSLTTLSLNKCERVCDRTIKCVLNNLKRLQCLSLSGCLNITDEVFLLDVKKQLMRDYVHDATYPDVMQKFVVCEDYDCHLSAVDISLCGQLTTYAIRHLTTLCGPTLKSVNISGTAVDCAGLLFLSGYSLSGAIQQAKGISDCYSAMSELMLPPGVLVELLPSGGLQEVLRLPSQDENDLCLESVRQEDADPEDITFDVECNKMSDVCFVADQEQQSSQNQPICEHQNCDTDRSQSSKSDCPVMQEGDLTVDIRTDASTGILQSDCFTNASCSSRLEASSSENSSRCEDTSLGCGVSSHVDRFSVCSRGPDASMRVYDPILQSLSMACISSDSPALCELSLQTLLIHNPQLQHLQMSWDDANNKLMEIIAKHAPNLRSLSVSSVADEGMTAVANNCPHLSSLELKDSSFIQDSAILPLLSVAPVRKLSLSATMITDKLLRKIRDLCAETLIFFDISWCEEITEAGVNLIVTSCQLLQTLYLRHCPISTHTLHLMASHCTNLRKLYLQGVNCVTDPSLVAMALRLHNLEILDISWNMDVTDIGITALMIHAQRLERLVSIGIKQITTKPFWLLVSDVASLRRCKASLLLEKKLRASQPDICSSDEEYEMDLPLRSSVHAPSLRRLELDWCDCASEAQLAEIALVCRGSIVITDYYGEIVKPAFVEDGSS